MRRSPQPRLVVDNTPKPYKPRINVKKLSGRDGVPYRYVDTDILIQWREEMRGDLDRLKKLRASAKGSTLQQKRSEQVWKMVGQIACISTTLRARWADPEDKNWQRFRKV